MILLNIDKLNQIPYLVWTTLGWMFFVGIFGLFLLLIYSLCMISKLPDENFCDMTTEGTHCLCFESGRICCECGKRKKG